jgi:hypothetical protein
MDTLIADKFSLIPTPTILQLCIKKHPDLKPKSWRQYEDILISFDLPDHYVIETTKSIRQPSMNGSS